MARPVDAGFLADNSDRMKERPEYYPDSSVRIVSPFFLHVCVECGKRSWSVLGELEICPHCGGRMELVHNDTQR